VRRTSSPRICTSGASYKVPRVMVVCSFAETSCEQHNDSWTARLWCQRSKTSASSFSTWRPYDLFSFCCCRKMTFLRLIAALRSRRLTAPFSCSGHERQLGLLSQPKDHRKPGRFHRMGFAEEQIARLGPGFSRGPPPPARRLEDAIDWDERPGSRGINETRHAAWSSASCSAR